MTTSAAKYISGLMDWENDQRVLADLLSRGIIRAPSSEVQAAFEDWKAQQAAIEIDSWKAEPWEDMPETENSGATFGVDLVDAAGKPRWSGYDYASESLAYLAASDRRREMIEATLRKPKSLRASVPSSSCSNR